MKKFNLSALSIALMIGGVQLAAVPSFAYAAEAEASTNAEDSTKKEDDKKSVEVIEVTGFRGSVIKSLNTKRFSDTVVDAISADDIGGLPDVSIADSLTRLPGVTSVRIDGQSSELNVRGLSGGFVFSTLNGREMVSTSGGRAVQFDIFPSELVSQAQVYKSQKASLIEGGIAATINLETANALDNDEDHSFRASLHGNYNEAAADNEDSDTFGRRLTLSYQGKYLDETLGVAVGWANMFQPTVSSRFVNYQFDKRDLSAAYDGAPEEILVSSGFEINERGGEDKRDAVVLALNWEPRDDLRFQFDGFYSKFDSEKWDRGLRVSGINNIAVAGSTLLLDNPLMANGALVGGTLYRDRDGTAAAPPFPGSSRDLNIQTQADDNTTESEMKSFGLKSEWDITDDLTMVVDFSHSEGSETYKDQVMRMAYFEDSSAEYPVIDDNIILKYQLNGLNNPYLEFNQDFTDTAHMMVTSAESYPHYEDNSSDAIRVDFAYQLESEVFSSVEFGARASQREYEVSRGRFLYGTTDYNMRNGQYLTFGTDADGNTIIVDNFAPFALDSTNSTVTSIGGDLSGMPNFLSVDNDAILNAWIPGVDRTPVRTWEHDWTMTQGNLVEEDVLAAYFQINIDAEVFGLPVTGNVGVRYVYSDQSSTGLVSVGAGNGDPIADDLGEINNNWQRKKVGDSYSDFLPSLNLNFQLSDDDQLRFAYAKVMSRPDMPTMANSGNFDWVEDKDEGRYQINLNSSTSPFLRPFYANQFDLSYEHYFSETDGAFVFAVWYKDIENMVGDAEDKNFDYEAAGIEVPPTPENKLYDPITGELIDYANGTYWHAENNADAGYMRGVEIGYTQTFSFLPGLLSGLGANVNFSYTDSEIQVESQVPGEDGAPGPIEGLSPRVVSATLFYDWEEKLSLRFSGRYRSAYLSQQIAIGSAQSAYFDEETIYSAQASYNFTDNFQAVVSADNITDEPNISYFGDTSRTGTIQYFGRTIYFGVNYSF
ncbi:TonB-dependent receptor [Litorilituus lipolyticus]|uniref:TonB-dependent receptor n=1 Tax=Litorilituus lipolyticus TaxID=2491017 RepID=A0A502KU62_9GAMM|nr:TonB-dependent receptor [Litorilituus lipolyticus]TPH15072.1 TonB-dependent receptor [Litorilituus lipolyticus]